jgi:hypothetical protein
MDVADWPAALFLLAAPSGLRWTRKTGQELRALGKITESGGR